MIWAEISIGIHTSPSDIHSADSALSTLHNHRYPGTLFHRKKSLAESEDADGNNAQYLYVTVIHTIYRKVNTCIFKPEIVFSIPQMHKLPGK